MGQNIGIYMYNERLNFGDIGNCKFVDNGVRQLVKDA